MISKNQITNENIVFNETRGKKVDLKKKANFKEISDRSTLKKG